MKPFFLVLLILMAATLLPSEAAKAANEEVCRSIAVPLLKTRATQSAQSPYTCMCQMCPDEYENFFSWCTTHATSQDLAVLLGAAQTSYCADSNNMAQCVHGNPCAY